MDVAFLILLFSWFFTVATTATPLVFLRTEEHGLDVSGKVSSEYKDIRVFIVVYRERERLYALLDRLLESDLRKYNNEIVIINNYGKLVLPDKYTDLTAPVRVVKIVQNYVRPDFSTGHLARDWNTALLHGFQSLTSPVTKYVVTMQDDFYVEKNWVEHLLALHTTRKFEIVQLGRGDAFMSYTAEGVRRVGIWDERFANIGYHEYDYFNRCLMYGRGAVTLNDDAGHYLNRLSTNEVREIHSANSGSEFRGMEHPDHKKSLVYHSISKAVLYSKYGGANTDFNYETQPADSVLPTLHIPTYMTYPYFEKDIYELEKKKYVL